ncbi:MAG: hypothetical protein AAFR76_11650 [Planctomycetota bacterium]
MGMNRYRFRSLKLCEDPEAERGRRKWFACRAFRRGDPDASALDMLAPALLGPRSRLEAAVRR